MSRTRFVIITGASGSGKTTALKTLEDLGFYAIDNLPVGLLSAFLHLVQSGHSEITRAAMVMDVRGRESFAGTSKLLEGLRESGYEITILYLSSSPESLQKRFSETRRVHPLDATVPLGEAVERENRLLEPLRQAADQILDTSGLGPHELRRYLRERFAAPETPGKMLVTFLSFGYKYGLPKEADLVFDVRFLPNPFFQEHLRARDGRDAEVVAFLDAAAATAPLLSMLEGFLRELLPLYVAEGRGYLTVAVGCTGGQHRSVAIVEKLSRHFHDSTLVNVQIRHRELMEG